MPQAVASLRVPIGSETCQSPTPAAPSAAPYAFVGFSEPMTQFPQMFRRTLPNGPPSRRTLPSTFPATTRGNCGAGNRPWEAIRFLVVSETLMNLAARGPMGL